ncbi:GTP-binding protein REM 1-like [Prionailurus bengalensis]|nr:GTP-binding protein REM 1-like [Prionailurus bengalensis]
MVEKSCVSRVDMEGIRLPSSPADRRGSSGKGGAEGRDCRRGPSSSSGGEWEGGRAGPGSLGTRREQGRRGGGGRGEGKERFGTWSWWVGRRRIARAGGGPDSGVGSGARGARGPDSRDPRLGWGSSSPPGRSRPPRARPPGPFLASASRPGPRPAPPLLPSRPSSPLLPCPLSPPPPPRAIPRRPPAVRPASRVSAMAGLGPRPAKGYRVVLLGSVAVGKTALATQFACGSFPEQCEPSVEELFSKVIEVNAAPALLEIVDTVGAEHLVTLKDLYIKNSDGFVVLYSVCSEASFEAVRPLRERMGRLRGPKAVPLVLVGTKADLDAERQVLTARGRALAREWRCPFLEVTAKSKLMVDQVFTQVVREVEALAPPEERAPALPTNAQDTWPSERFIG